MERRIVRICRAGDQLSGNVLSAITSGEDGGGSGRRTLQDIQADTAQLVNIGVEDLGEEADLGGSHGVVIREKELKLEDAACTYIRVSTDCACE